jgi:hypothetical protein
MAVSIVLGKLIGSELNSVKVKLPSWKVIVPDETFKDSPPHLIIYDDPLTSVFAGSV